MKEAAEVAMNWDGKDRRIGDERVAVLEAEVKVLQQSHCEIQDKLDTILHKITRYQGFLGNLSTQS